MGNAVPPGSLLWTLWHSLWKAVVMYNTPFQPVQLLDLLRIIWPHIVRALYWHWENSVAIPNVNTWELLTSYQQRQHTLGRHTMSHLSTESTLGHDAASYPTEVDPFNPEISPVNLRYILVHQKLAILNACILRKIRKEQQVSAEAAESVSLADRYEQLLHSSAHPSTTVESEGSHYCHRYPSQPLIHKAVSSAEGFRNTLVVPDYNTLFPQSQRRRLSAFLRASNNVVGREGEMPDTRAQPMGPVPGHLPSTTERDFSGVSDSDSNSASKSESDASLNSSRSSSFHNLPSLAHIQEVGPFDPRVSLPLEVHRSESAPVSGGPDQPKESDFIVIREGHAYPLLSHTLLQTGKPLWVPETQETPLMTEDMIHAQEFLFVELGTSEEAALVRAKTLSALLFSDMQAFKAANPGCILEDFVRWYSPRDWVDDIQTAQEGIGAMGNAYFSEAPEGCETSLSVVTETNATLSPEGGESEKGNGNSVYKADEQTTLRRESSVPPSGQLSLRMAEDDNLWKQLWKEAKPVPITRQKPLFCFHQEALHALAYLEFLPVEDLFKQMLPTTFHLAYGTYSSSPLATRLPYVRQLLTTLGETCRRFSWHTWNVYDCQHEKLLNQLETIEIALGRATSLLHRFPLQFNLVNRLLVEKEAKIDNNSFHSGTVTPLNHSSPSKGSPKVAEARKEHQAVAALFYNYDSSNRRLAKQEYIFRTKDYPHTTERHQLYVAIDEGIRMCEAVTQETSLV
ncbi:hypothetical protein IWQ61_009201 [Dispira simplex]|nr:hypothetical protein IWQ61_009201 [Dispira simplex]